MQVRLLIVISFFVFVIGQESVQLTSGSSDGRSEVMEEYLLYLTPNEAQALQAKGAIVRPLPQLQNDFLQQYQANIGDNTELQNQTVPIGQRQQYKDLNNINKSQTTKAPMFRTQPTVNPLRKRRPKTKNISRLRQQKNTSSKVPSAQNNTKTNPPEYKIRYLPNLEDDVLKIQPYRTQPLPGYYFDENYRNLEFPSYALSETNSQSQDILKIDENPSPETSEKFNTKFQLQEPDSILKQETFLKPAEIQTPLPVQRQQNTLQPGKIQNSVLTQEQASSQTPAEIQNSVPTQQPEIIQGLAGIQRYVTIQIPIDVEGQEQFKNILGIQNQAQNLRVLNFERQFETPETTQRPEGANLQVQIIPKPMEPLRDQKPFRDISINQSSRERTGPVVFNDNDTLSDINDDSVENNSTSFQMQTSSRINQDKLPSMSTSMTSFITNDEAVQMQYSTLLAPLLQHEKVMDNAAEQKALVNNEKAIHFKLLQITHSGNNTTEYKSELEKLKQNLGQQNILAEKVAMQNFAKKPKDMVKEKSTQKKRRPVGKMPAAEQLQIITPRPVSVSWETPDPNPKSKVTVTPRPVSWRTATPTSVSWVSLSPKPSSWNPVTSKSVSWESPSIKTTFWGTSTPIPVAVLQRDTVQLEQSSRTNDDKDITVYIPGRKKVKTKSNIPVPYLVQNITPVPIGQDVPQNSNQPENLFILRPIWEH